MPEVAEQYPEADFSPTGLDDAGYAEAIEILDDWLSGSRLIPLGRRRRALSLASVPGVVHPANTISRETSDWAITPRGAVLWASSPYLRDKLASDALVPVVEPKPEPAPAQVELFA